MEVCLNVLRPHPIYVWYVPDVLTQAFFTTMMLKQHLKNQQGTRQ